MTITLRPRQVQAVADLRNAYAFGHRAPILVAPTGFGKTATATEIVRLTIARGRSVWFLAHLREILDDTAARLTAAGISHGSIRAGRLPDYLQLVQVVAVQTAVRRAELPRPDLIIVDECHLAVAESYRKVITAAGNPRLLGLTGTPQRLDGRGLGEVFDLLVPTCSTAELIDEGLLAPIRIFAPPGVDLSGVGRRGGDFDQGAAGAVMNRPQVVGDALKHWQKLCAGRRGVAFCTTVAHAQAVAEQWQRAGFRAMAVHGGSDDAERREAVAGLRAGRLDLVACAQLWIAGVDVPEIDAVIWLRPTQSLTAWLQGNGRGLRCAPGKSDLLILDHVSNVERHGLPTDLRQWSLKGRKKRASDALSVKVCPSCFAALPSQATVCDCCGHEFHREESQSGGKQIDGDLVEVKSRRLECGADVDVWFGEQWKPGFVLVEWPAEGAPTVQRASGGNTWRVKREHVRLPGSGGKYQKPAVECHAHERQARRAEQSSAQTYDDLVRIGHRRGMANPRGWARHVMAAREAKRARSGPVRVVA